MKMVRSAAAGRAVVVPLFAVTAATLALLLFAWGISCLIPVPGLAGLWERGRRRRTKKASQSFDKMICLV